MFDQRGLRTLRGETEHKLTLRVRANGCEFVSCDCVCWAQCSRAGVRQAPARGCPPVGVKYVGRRWLGLWRTASESTLTLRPVTPFASPLRPPLQCPTVTSPPLGRQAPPYGSAGPRVARTRVGSAGRSCAHRISPVQAQRAHGGVPAFPGSPHFPDPPRVFRQRAPGDGP